MQYSNKKIGLSKKKLINREYFYFRFWIFSTHRTYYLYYSSSSPFEPKTTWKYHNSSAQNLTKTHSNREQTVNSPPSKNLDTYHCCGSHDSCIQNPTFTRCEFKSSRIFAFSVGRIMECSFHESVRSLSMLCASVDSPGMLVLVLLVLSPL